MTTFRSNPNLNPAARRLFPRETVALAAVRRYEALHNHNKGLAPSVEER